MHMIQMKTYGWPLNHEAVLKNGILKHHQNNIPQNNVTKQQQSRCRIGKTTTGTYTQNIQRRKQINTITSEKEQKQHGALNTNLAEELNLVLLKVIF